MGRTTLEVTPEGVVTAIVGREVLAWISDQHAPPGQTYIQPIALPEFVLEACRFFHGYVLPRGGGELSISNYFWRAGMRGLSEGVRLVKQRYHPYIPLHHHRNTPLEPHAAENFTLEWAAATETDAERHAFEVLKHVYFKFGYPPEQIPFQDADAISGETLRSLR